MCPLRTPRARQYVYATPGSSLVSSPIARLVAGVVCAAALAIGPALAHAEKPQVPSYADCGAMWLDGAQARARIDVYAGLTSRRDSVVRYDLPPEYTKVGEPLPAVAVYECQPGGQTDAERPPRLQPVAAISARTDDGVAQVKWTLTGQSLALGQRRYHVYVAPSGKALQGAAVVGEPVRLPGENLLVNAGFERASEDDRNPAGWYVSGQTREGAIAASALRVSGQARTGSFAFVSSLQGPGAAAATAKGGTASLAEPVPVRPGVKYILDGWVKVSGGPQFAAALSAPFLDADGQDLGVRIEASTRGRLEAGWMQVRGWAFAPERAHFIRLSLFTEGDAGTATFDDLSLYADPVGMGSPPRVLPLPLEDRGAARRPLQLPRGGEAWLFDFGPEGSPVAGGFIGVHPGLQLEEGGLYGFCEAGERSAGAGPRPDVMASDWVDFGQTSFCLAMPDGPVVVWMVLGDYSPPASADAPMPSLYSQSVAVQAGVVQRRADNPTLDFRSLHNEIEDDAVLQAKSGGLAPYERYVAPRFTSLLFESEVQGGKLKVLCQPSGACPISAVGVFRGATLPQISDELAYFTALRRWSFSVAWAQPVEAPTSRLPLTATADEQRLGFAAFQVDTEADVYPQTVPTREQIDQLRGGISVRLARGETTSASFGIYPLVFRRTLGVQLDPLVDRKGDGIGGDAVQVHQVRYRFQRHQAYSGDPRYAVRPTELGPAEGMSVRPGITRQLWLTLSAPANAAPGTYTGSLLLDAGPDRTLTIPVSVEVLPLTLPASRAHHGLLGGHYAPGGDAGLMLRDLAAHGMTLLDLPGAPLAQLGPSGPLAAFDVWQAALDTTAAAGLRWAALTTGLTVEPAFSLTGEARTEPGLGLPLHWRAKRSFGPAFEAAARELIDQAQRTAAGRKWPPLVQYVAFGGAAAGEAGLVYERKWLELCRSASGAVCAASITGTPSPESLEAMDAVLVTPSHGLDQNTLDSLRTTAKGRNPRSVWLHNVGGSRYGRGLYAWAARADAVVDDFYAGVPGAADPFDPWDSEVTQTPFVFPAPAGVVTTLRWERARLGTADARWLAFVESRIAAAQKKGLGGADAVKRAELFLRELQARLDLRAGQGDVHWDGRLLSRGFPSGPDFDLLRAALIDLALQLQALL